MHHSAIVVGDLESSIRFYRDGLGLEVLMEAEFDGDWPSLFGAPGTTLRSVFLGDAAAASSGIVELVTFAEASGPAASPARLPGASPRRAPASGFFLLSFYVDVDTVLARLAGLGHEDVRRIEVPGPLGKVAMATLHDPDGVLVELVGANPG